MDRTNFAVIGSAVFFAIVTLLFMIPRWWLVVLVVGTLPAVLFIWWLWRIARPTHHPALARLSRYGPLADIIASLDAALDNAPATHEHYGAPVVADGRECWVWDGWLIGFGIANALPVEAITRANKQVTSYVMFPVPIAWEAKVILWDRMRQRTELPLRTYNVEPFFAQLREHNPAIQFGHYT